MRRILGTIILVVLAFIIAKAGRFCLDWMVSVRPEWSEMLERGGGWLIGIVVVVVVLLPLLRLYGVLGHSRAKNGQ